MWSTAPSKNSKIDIKNYPRLKNMKQEVKFFSIFLFLASLLIWAFFRWLLPEYPLNESEMIAVVAIVAVLAYLFKRWQNRKSQKQDR